jgi:hypothetical protein
MNVFDRLLHISPIASPVDLRGGKLHACAATKVHYDAFVAGLGRLFYHGIQVYVLGVTTQAGKATEKRPLRVLYWSPTLMINDPIERDGALIT